MSAVTATGPLLQLALRRDRVMIPIWLYALVASVVGTAWSYRSLYPTVADRRRFAKSAESNGATRGLYGHVYGPDSVGGLTAWRLVALGGVLLAVFIVLVVIRHSRAEEQSGRIELLSATVVGRAAPLAAAVGAGLIAAFAVSVLVAAGLIVMGLPVAGSLAFGAAWLGLGVVFAGVGSVAAQLTSSARTARGSAIAVLGACFAVRVIADDSVGWLTWCTPFGWAQQLRPFGGNRWWVLLFPVLASAALVAVGYALHARRDLGAGLLPGRPGPAHAGRLLSSTLGLTARLGRGSLLAWFVGSCIYGLVIGGVASSVSELTNGSKATEDLLAKLGGRGGLIDAFLGATLGIATLAAAAFGVTAMLRAREEESTGRLDAVLATGVGRLRWFGGHLVFALFGTTALVLGAGLSAGIMHGSASTNVGHQVGAVVTATAVQLPAVWLVTSLSAVLVGCAPRAAQASWALVGVCAAVSLIGPIANAGQAVLDVSPFSHLPATPGLAVPTGAVSWTLVLVGVAVAVAVIGLRRRDIE
jgi:ABC-2 type transport system permease protein